MRSASPFLASPFVAACLALCGVLSGASPALAQFRFDEPEESDAGGGIDSDRLLELIEETVRANEERRLGREFLVDYATPAEEAQGEALRASLDARRVTVNFDQTTFSDCIEFLTDVTGLNFVVSKSVLDEFGQSPIRLRLKNVSVRSCLNLLLEQTGEEVRYGVRLGVLWIGQRSERTQRLVLRFYDVSDIVRRLPDFPGPRLGLKGLSWDD